MYPPFMRYARWTRGRAWEVLPESSYGIKVASLMVNSRCQIRSLAYRWRAVFNGKLSDRVLIVPQVIGHGCYDHSVSVLR